VDPSPLQILLLGLIQGAAELLPVSSSAHVIVAEKLMGLDPSSPTMTFLLVMLHSGTMLAVILYFWQAWKSAFFRDRTSVAAMLKSVGTATALTLVVGLVLKKLIETVFLKGSPHGDLEDLFSRLPLVASALFIAGLVILWAGRSSEPAVEQPIGPVPSVWIGASQGLCLPFRGLSRSGITISTGMLLGLPRQRVEEFSFALAVVITPPVVAQELHRLLKASGASGASLDLLPLLGPGVLGLVAAFGAGLVALRLLSSWLEQGHWGWFGLYCLAFSGFVFVLAGKGF
jgi:undecaprenyl-diphosphatase